jgi:hypothetical protein
VNQLPCWPMYFGGAVCGQVLREYPKSTTQGHVNNLTFHNAYGFYSPNLNQSIHIFPVSATLTVPKNMSS